MKYTINIKGTWENTDHPYDNYHDAFKAYDNFIVLYSNVKNVTIILYTGEGDEKSSMQQITF